MTDCPNCSRLRTRIDTQKSYIALLKEHLRLANESADHWRTEAMLTTRLALTDCGASANFRAIERWNGRQA